MRVVTLPEQCKVVGGGTMDHLFFPLVSLSLSLLKEIVIVSTGEGGGMSKKKPSDLNDPITRIIVVVHLVLLISRKCVHANCAQMWNRM